MRKATVSLKLLAFCSKINFIVFPILPSLGLVIRFFSILSIILKKAFQKKKNFFSKILFSKKIHATFKKLVIDNNGRKATF